VAGDRQGIEQDYELGLALVASAQYFAAHEALEAAWRAAVPEERDFFQGLVHVAVAWYQAERGNAVGCRRQLAKARRRLLPYSPAHRELDVGDLLDQVAAAEERFPRLDPVRIHRL
jgi:predicted metal-dependent hydrolase